MKDIQLEVGQVWVSDEPSKADLIFIIYKCERTGGLLPGAKALMFKNNIYMGDSYFGSNGLNGEPVLYLEYLNTWKISHHLTASQLTMYKVMV